jgi:hypothetical protein
MIGVTAARAEALLPLRVRLRAWERLTKKQSEEIINKAGRST